MADTGDPTDRGEGWGSVADERRPRDVRPEVPHPARVYDYLLGGKDNFAADREAAERVVATAPHARTAARQNRAFLRRATRFLAAQAGIRQFLDIGTGIPTSPNVHEVTQEIAAESRVVYADNDPTVLAHARALLTSNPKGKVAYIDADLRDPEQIINAPQLRDTLDLTRPVALSLLAILHFIPDSDDPYGIVDRLLAALPPGSYLALSHATTIKVQPKDSPVVAAYRCSTGVPLQARSRAEIERFFDGLALVDPGVQVIHRWRPDDSNLGELADVQVGFYGGVARKR